MAKDTPVPEPVKPARTRRAKAEPEVVVEPTPEPKPDRRLPWALGFLAAVAVFVAGYFVGHAAGEDEVVVGSGRIVVDGELPGGPWDHTPYEMPYDMPYEMPYDMPHHGGGHRYPGPDVPVPVPDQDAPAAGGYLGIAGVDTPGSVLIVEVVPGSPADDAGIEPGDRVISYDGTPIDTMEQLADLVRDTAPGTTVTIVLGGPGGAHEVTVTVGSRAD